MLIGHEKLTETFKRLIQEDQLSHAYLFFGEPQVGKFSFGLALANYLEGGQFEKPSRTLGETFVIQPDAARNRASLAPPGREEWSIGIDKIRELKRFLLQKPAFSSRRTVVIDNAELLTAQAQHAILKIAEEPPSSSLVILIVSNAEILLPTLQSRLQSVYFPRLGSAAISGLLNKEFKMTKKQADEIAKISFGRPGRAVRLVGSTEPAFAKATARQSKKALITEMTENPEFLKDQLTEVIAKLAKDPVKNYTALRSILNRLTKISQFNTNKRLQLETALWNI